MTTADCPTLDELPPDIDDEEDEHEETFELTPHYVAGEDVAIAWTGKGMDHWAWLWRWLDDTRVGVKVLVAGKNDWHASKFSTVNGSRAVPRKLLPISTNPVDHFDETDDPCLLTKAAPIQPVWRRKLALVFGVIVANVLLFALLIPGDDYEFKASVGAYHGLLLSLWLCTFFGWRIRGPVSYAKFVLQMRAPWVWTPGQLYREIERRNERMGW
ncbi:MAG: hypothetical protein ACR2RF_14345 [Geminicoccaceae bacterium]